MTWHMIRAFGATDYPAVMRHQDAQTRRFSFRRRRSCELTPPMRRKDDWYVAGWKLHLSIYPADYALALSALRLFEERIADRALVFKYAASRQLYSAFSGAVKGKFTTIYCKAAADIPPLVQLVNQLFTQEGITPLNRLAVQSLEGLRHELPLVGGYAFVRYGAFCYTKGILDLTDPERAPMADSRRRPFPRFRDPGLLESQMARFDALVRRHPDQGA